MAKARVPLYKTPGKSVVIETEGSGATFGKTLYDSNGNILTISKLKSILGLSSYATQSQSVSQNQTGYYQQGMPIALWRPTTTLEISSEDYSTHSEVTGNIGGKGIGAISLVGTKILDKVGSNIEYGAVGSGVTLDDLQPAEKDADVTSVHIAAAIAGQGALATKSAVDLSTAEVTNKTAANIKFTAAGTPTVDSLMPAEVGANITASHQSATTAALTGHTQDDLPDGTNSLQWRKVQQDALFSGGENQLLDPGLTSIAFWSHAPLSNGTIGGQTLAAGANQYISQHDGHGSLKYLRVSAGQSISVSYDLVTAGTGDAVAVFYVILQDTTGGGLQYVLPPNTFGTPPFSRVLTAPTGTVRGLVLWNFGASTFGGTAPVLSNPVVRLGSQTVIDAGGAKGYGDLGDNTPNGWLNKDLEHVLSNSYTVATLPVGAIGQRALVTDAVSPSFLGTLTGGGAVTTSVFHNGTSWVVG